MFVVSSLPLSKTPPFFFSTMLPLTSLGKMSKPPFLGNPSKVYWLLLSPPLKIRYFSEPENFSSLIPSHLNHPK